MKKGHVIVLVLVISIFWYSCSTDKPKTLPDVVDSWISLSGKYTNLPMEIRLNQGLEPIIAHPGLQYQMGISVPLYKPLDNGLPDSTERGLLKILEQKIVAAFAEKNETYFAIVVTTNSTCEYIFYSRGKRIQEKFDKARQQITAYKLKLNTLKDPRWGVYKQFMNPF